MFQCCMSLELSVQTWDMKTKQVDTGTCTEPNSLLRRRITAKVKNGYIRYVYLSFITFKNTIQNNKAIDGDKPTNGILFV